MTPENWKELSSLLKQYKSAERAVDKLTGKLEATKRIRDTLAEQVRDAMPPTGE